MRRIRFMPIALSSFAITVAALAPAASRAGEPVEVVRVGDRDMTCPALATEINTLSAPQQAVAKPKRRGLGFLKILGTAVPFVGMGSAVGSMMLSSAAGAAQTVAADGQMADAQRIATDAMAGPGPAEQRKARLTEIFEEKGC